MENSFYRWYCTHGSTDTTTSAAEEKGYQIQVEEEEVVVVEEVVVEEVEEMMEVEVEEEEEEEMVVAAAMGMATLTQAAVRVSCLSGGKQCFKECITNQEAKYRQDGKEQRIGGGKGGQEEAASSK